MALNVKFLKGTNAEYTAAKKDVNAFYYVDEKDLYLGTIKLSNAADLQAAITRIAANETHIGDIGALTTTQKASLTAAINEVKAEVAALTGGETGGISHMIAAVTGNLTDLTTDARTNLVAAINELDAALDAEKTNSKVTLEEGTSADYAKVYTVKQGATTVGTINIPKDMVVQSGRVVTNPDTEHVGTFIELVLANATSDKIYVEVGKLVDIYTAQQSATQVQLAIDSSSREISATIVAGSITATELAANAVTTAKIANGNVTLEKLATDVQTSLGKADSALQASDIAEGGKNGTISVKGTDVAVKGLGSAAYANTKHFEAAGSVKSAYDSVESHLQQLNNNLIDVSQRLGKKIEDDDKTNLAAAKSYTDTSIEGLDADVSSAAVEAGKGIKVQVVETDGKVTSVAVSGDYSATYDALGAATTAETNAKTYTDNALTWNSIA